MAERGFDKAISPSETVDYHRQAKRKLKRVALASFLCAVAACLLVSLIGFVLAFGYTQFTALTNGEQSMDGQSGGFLLGMGYGTLMATMNWFVGYLTIPAAWLALGFSIGRFPGRGIISAMPYYRWGAIWGAILVGGTTTIATALVGGGQDIGVPLGAMVAGLSIGALAGAACGWLFLAIVRPADQVRHIEISAF